MSCYSFPDKTNTIRQHRRAPSLWPPFLPPHPLPPLHCPTRFEQRCARTCRRTLNSSMHRGRTCAGSQVRWRSEMNHHANRQSHKQSSSAARGEVETVDCDGKLRRRAMTGLRAALCLITPTLSLQRRSIHSALHFPELEFSIYI